MTFIKRQKNIVEGIQNNNYVIYMITKKFDLNI